MTFNNVNIFRSVVKTLNTSGVNSTADKIKRGEAFSPTTFEAVALMRSQFDNQWDNSYITKYEALLQTRLNRLKQELNNAYKALLEISGGMHIREDADKTSSNKALRSVYGTTIPGGSQKAFEDMKYYKNSTEFEDADSDNGTTVDGIPSYLQSGALYSYDDNGVKTGNSSAVYEMRRLYVTGPALQIVNNVTVSMRTEEVLGKAPQPNFSGLQGLLGTPPFMGQQKVAEYSTEAKTGGFWSTVNYLFNFSPREIKYNYVTAYSTTSEEAGTRQKGSRQATLYNNEVLDARDTGKAGMNDNTDNYTVTNRPPNGERVKWNPGENSYITEKNTFTSEYAQIDNREIVRRQVYNDADFEEYMKINNRANDDVKSSFPLAPDGGSAIKAVEYGDEEIKNAPISRQLKWEYQHDGKGAADLNQDGNVNGNDQHKVKAAFLNHYTVQTKTVELNSSKDSYGEIDVVEKRLLRSTGVDGSADHIHNDKDKDGIIDNSEDEKILMPGSSKISKSFNGKFIGSLHTIDSFNNQEISSNNGNIVFNKPVILGEYEGFERAKMMSKGVADDYFDEINSLSRTKEKAEELAARVQSEVNGSSIVDSDWHYSQYKDNDNNPTNGVRNDEIMFKIIKDVGYDGGRVTIKYDPSKVVGTNDGSGSIINPTSYKDPIVAFRKTFNLSSDEIITKDYSGTVTADPMFINTPNYTYKDVRIKIETSALKSSDIILQPGPIDTTISHIDLIVNGKLVPPENSSGVYNLKGYLKEGENVITAQMRFNGSGDHYFKLVNDASNSSDVSTWVESKLSTDRTKNGDASFPKFNANPDYGYTSSWQSKLMVEKPKFCFVKKDGGSSVFPKLGNSPISVMTESNYYAIIMFGSTAEKQELLKNWKFSTNYYYKKGGGSSNFPTLSPSSSRSYITEAEYNTIMQSGTQAEKDDLNANWYKLSEDEFLSIGSERTATKVKDSNPLLRVLVDALNNPEYRDIFYLGMLNSNIGKNLQLKASVSAPTGGSIDGTLDVRYNPKDHKFTLVQSKYDAFGGI